MGYSRSLLLIPTLSYSSTTILFWVFLSVKEARADITLYHTSKDPDQGFWGPGKAMHFLHF
jgi:hypothetical protein